VNSKEFVGVTEFLVRHISTRETWNDKSQEYMLSRVVEEEMVKGMVAEGI
jgi:hypothetical protein